MKQILEAAEVIIQLKTVNTYITDKAYTDTQ